MTNFLVHLPNLILKWEFSPCFTKIGGPCFSCSLFSFVFHLFIFWSTCNRLYIFSFRHAINGNIYYKLLGILCEFLVVLIESTSRHFVKWKFITNMKFFDWKFIWNILDRISDELWLISSCDQLYRLVSWRFYQFFWVTPMVEKNSWYYLQVK